ncbi:acid phosphatase det1 [Batrachochytrium dendrobatidis]
MHNSHSTYHLDWRQSSNHASTSSSVTRPFNDHSLDMGSILNSAMPLSQPCSINISPHPNLSTRSLNLLKRLQEREMCPHLPGRLTLDNNRFYSNVYPNKTAFKVNQQPEFVVRKFTVDGHYLICFSKNTHAVRIYRYHIPHNYTIYAQPLALHVASQPLPFVSDNTARSNDSLETSLADGSYLASTTQSNPTNSSTVDPSICISLNSSKSHFKPSHTKSGMPSDPVYPAEDHQLEFDTVFKIHFEKLLTSGSEMLCKDFCLFAPNGRHMILSSAVPSGNTVEEGRRFPSSLDCIRNLDHITFWVMDIHTGEVTDKMTFKNDYIYLTNHAGVHLHQNLLGITSVQNQCVYILKLLDAGKLIHINTVGYYTQKDDEAIIERQNEVEAEFRREAKKRQAQLDTPHRAVRFNPHTPHRRTVSSSSLSQFEQVGLIDTLENAGSTAPLVPPTFNAVSTHDTNIAGTQMIADVPLPVQRESESGRVLQPEPLQQQQNPSHQPFRPRRVSFTLPITASETARLLPVSPISNPNLHFRAHPYPLPHSRLSSQSQPGRLLPHIQQQDPSQWNSSWVEQFPQDTAFEVRQSAHPYAPLPATRLYNIVGRRVDIDTGFNVPRSPLAGGGPIRSTLQPPSTSLHALSRQITSQTDANTLQTRAVTSPTATASAVATTSDNNMDRRNEQGSTDSMPINTGNRNFSNLGFENTIHSLSRRPTLRPMVHTSHGIATQHSSRPFVPPITQRPVTLGYTRDNYLRQNSSVETNEGYDSQAESMYPLSGIKHRMLAYLYRRAIASKVPGAIGHFHLTYPYFASLVMWRMQFLDCDHILLKLGSIDNVTGQLMEQATGYISFFVVYSLSTTKILGVYENSSQELFDIFEKWGCFHGTSYMSTRSTPVPDCPTSQSEIDPFNPDSDEGVTIHAMQQYATLYCNNEYARDLARKHMYAVRKARNGGASQAIRRILSSLPINPQSFSTSAYFDHDLFSYDDKVLNSCDRMRSSLEFPCKFYCRRTGKLKFKLETNAMANGRTRGEKTNVLYIFHPVDPFVITVQHVQNIPTVMNMHYASF